MTGLKIVTTSKATSTKGRSSGPGSLWPQGAIRYTELLGRTHFSFLRGASSPEEMIEQARKLGYEGMAICDVNGLYGVVRAHAAITHPSHFIAPEGFHAHPFKLIVGAEMVLNDRSSLALLAINKEGYTRLCQLITLAKRPAPKGYTALSLEDICENHEDLIALPLPPWELGRLQKLQKNFYDRLYLPVWKDMTWESLRYYQHGLELEKMGFNLVATQRPLMHHESRKPLHDVLTCILHGTTLSAARTKLLPNREHTLRPLSDLALVWRERPDLLLRSIEVANRIDFSLTELKYQYPQAALPPQKNATEYLRELTEEGLARRYPLGVPEKVRGIVERELHLIHDLAYEDYFLTLYDICEFARQQEILFQGRGSAANSVVCYALGLTAVDPTKVDLLFERFISKERGEPPDIDIDFDSQRREEVIQYIYRKYGSSHAAMVCTVICYRSRMALRDTAKVLSIPAETINHMIKFMGKDGLKRLVDNPEKASDWGMSARQFQLLMEIAGELKGFPRHLGIHTGGFLIAQRPINECVPVEKATMDQRFVVQWNKDDLTILKMMKIDVLGLGMLGALQRAFEMLSRHKRQSLDLAHIPSDDRPTYTMISKADTVGVFQIESRAQMSLLPRLQPRNYYDLVVEVAIVRPGPIQGGMVHPYIRRRHGQERVHFAHPALEPILKKTFGVPIFQEQIMQMASAVGGFTPGEADELRRIMSSSWKKAELMHGLRQRLINGMLANGISTTYAEQIYQTIVGFASYGFPESHAASFALLTYASSYIKCHHPEVFVCALLNSQPMGFYPPRMLIADAQRHQVKFLPVDIQISHYDYDLEATPTESGSTQSWSVRAGVRAIYGLKSKHTQTILNERSLRGPFKDLHDLVRRAPTPRSVLLRLAAAGAFRSLGLDARQAIWQVQALELQPESLFFGSARENLESSAVAPLPEESNWEELSREYSHQGFSLTHHPIGILRPHLKGQTTANALVRTRPSQRIRISGLLSLTQRPPTARGFAFLSVEDETGIFNVVLTPDVYEACRLTLAFHPLIQIDGIVEKSRGVINIRARHIEAIPVRRLLDSKPSMSATSSLPKV